MQPKFYIELNYSQRYMYVQARRGGRARHEMKKSCGSHEPISSEAAAAYVAELSAELASLAREHGLDALGFILDMARLEAENATHPSARPQMTRRI
jgi:hypothetical protein